MPLLTPVDEWWQARRGRSAEKMKRRDFLKISAGGGAAFTLEGCSKQGTPLIRFIPEETLVPGVAVWRPGVCDLCAASCGLQVKVMQGEAEVVRNGQSGLIKTGLAKKLEGNPQHPVNRGKLCARGQAGLQLTYNPDRIGQPLKRAGQRGSGEFVQINWEEAIEIVVGHLTPLIAQQTPSSLAFLTRPLTGQRQTLVERFLSGFNRAQLVPFEFFDDSVLREANRLSFGYNQLPTFDIARSNYLISFGADFLGTWNSLVANNIGYGAMRQGHSGIRGKFVQFESRMSQTGANADEWIATKPGTEGQLALALAHVILGERLAQATTPGTAASRIVGWKQGLPDYSPQAVAWKTGVSPETINRIAHELAAAGSAVAVVGGAPLAHTNGLSTALAMNALNELLGSIGRWGGLFFSPALPTASSKVVKVSEPESGSIHSFAEQVVSAAHPTIQVLFINGANPVFATPPAWRVREALASIPFIVSFGNFIDETSKLADLVLPDHSYLESWVDDVPESGALDSVLSIAPPAMLPLHETRAWPDVLLDLAHRLGGKANQGLPWKTYDEMLKAAYTPLQHFPGSITAKTDDEFWQKLTDAGVWSSTDHNHLPRKSSVPAAHFSIQAEDPKWDGDAKDYPLQFLPYASQQFLDGSLANLSWLQQLPDVLSTAMWSSWVEINPQTAVRLNIQQGDLVEVSSQHGKVRAPALLSPGIAPDLIAMPLGQGHDEYGRYATSCGANPVQLLAPNMKTATGSFAWASTRVNLVRIGTGDLILYSKGPTQWDQQKVSR
jgi:anaerobic selenocysteine-containing dehydrogenase